MAPGSELLVAHATNKNGLIEGALLTLKSDGNRPTTDYHDEWANSMNAPRFLDGLEHVRLERCRARRHDEESTVGKIEGAA